MRTLAQVVDLKNIVLMHPLGESGWPPAKPFAIQPEFIAGVGKDRQINTYGCVWEKKSLRKSATSCAPTSWALGQTADTLWKPGWRNT